MFKLKGLSYIRRLFQLKILNSWSAKSVKMLLILLNEMLPESETLLYVIYESKRLTGSLGFAYIKIDLYNKDCMLYRK